MTDANTGNDGKPGGPEAGRTSSFGDSGREPVGQIGPYRLLSALGEVVVDHIRKVIREQGTEEQ
ncbi:MAG: hypothetical protein JSW66_02545 [Phycisphaerales bacterium]|nr:MAG: hypothetical protein JSW66_02545 [Phycisphaerales bacterium]